MTNPTPSALITLGYSADHGLIGLPTGRRYRSAQDALKDAGFIRLPDSDPYTLPLSDLDAVRATLRDLPRLAHGHGVSVNTLDRPYLGDMAERIAYKLPGAWAVRVDVYCVPVWQTDLLDWLWSKGELPEVLAGEQLQYGAVLTDGTTELLLADRPGHPGDYLAGTLLPGGFDRSHTGTAYAPHSVRLPASASLAAHVLTTELLPHHHYAAHRLRTDQVAAALDAGQQALDAWDAVSDSLADEQGFPLDDDVYGRRVQQRDAEVWEQFQIYLDHGAALLDTTEAHLAKQHHVDRQLMVMRGLLQRGHDDVALWRQEFARVRKAPEPQRDTLYAQVVAERNADAWDAMVTWLEQGPDLIPLARSVPTPAPALGPAPRNCGPAPSAAAAPPLPQKPRLPGDPRGR
ncbi:hypothetical protein ACWGCC_03795 [Streptomyces nigrescens]